MMASPISILLSLALALTTATQLRLSGMVIGPGELLLFAWLAIAAITLVKSRVSPFNTATGLVFSAFWGVSATTMMIGALLGMALDSWSLAGALHDALAYGLSLALCVGVVMYPYSTHDLRRLTMYLTLAFILPITVLWLYAQVHEGLGEMGLWYGLRFTGWAENPNQTALLLLMAPFLALHHIEADAAGMSHDRLLAWLFLLSAALAVGWSTDSGALRLAWTVCLGLLAAGISWQVLARKPGAIRLLLAMLLGLLLAGMLLRATDNTPVRTIQAERVQRASAADDARGTIRIPGLRGLETLSMQQVYYEGNELAIRMALIGNGIKAIWSSPLVGYGPGGFSGLERPFQGSEAHNALLDWGTNTGLVGMTALVALVAWLARRLWLAGHFSLLAGLGALAIFAQFHHVLRHPLVWAYLALVGCFACATPAIRSRLSDSIGMSGKAISPTGSFPDIV